MSVSGRADGSSRLAEGNKWGFFPSAAVGWIVSEENFYSGNFLNFMKLRVGYGEVGNTAIRPYQTLGGLTNTNYAFGDSQAFGFGMQVIPNPDLRWEISKTLNIGFDYGFLNDRVSGSIELYNTNTQDLLLNRFLPITSGYSSIVQNIGSTRNRGIEFSASTYIFQNTNDGFNWNVDLNLFSNKEEIVSLTDSKNDDVGNRWFIGQPINVFYSFLQEGIWQAGEVTEANSHGQAPGDIKIADINGRDELGQLTNQSDGVINQDDRTVLGSTVPTWSGGMTNRFSYKGFTLSVLVFARQGQMLQSNYHNMGGNDWQGRHGKINLNYWTPDNPSNEIPMPIAARSPLYGDAVTYFDASFVKIKNISLGYTLDNKLTSRIRSGSSIRIYTTLDNSDMLTFSKFKRVDPEQGTGMVGGGIPLTTTNIIFGLNVNF
ncbi:MAG: TonB-dependent receptor [Cyclobacteriaceae bacterium]